MLLNTSPTSRPLVLDLDGTLLKTDTFHELMILLLRKRPWILLSLPFWFLNGRAYAKARLAEKCQLNCASLPYNLDLLTFAKGEAKNGRQIILATGSDQRVAEMIADHFGFFHEIIGSDGTTNMTGSHKRAALLERFGRKGFDYAGDSDKDPIVWEAAHIAIVVSPKAGVLKKVSQLKPSDELHYFPQKHSSYTSLLKSLCPLFWPLNILAPSWPLFWAFTLATSGLFILGDLLSIPTERTRSMTRSAYAEGHLNLVQGMFISVSLLTTSYVLFSSLLPNGALWALVYFILFGVTNHLTRFSNRSFRWVVLGSLQILFVLLYGQGL